MVSASMVCYLFDNYQIQNDIFVTLSDKEWQKRSSDFKRSVRNVGRMNINDLMDFYNIIDATIFPSLLECFSVMPLESVLCCRPVFCSDRDFVRDILGDIPYYFDPKSPESIARTIAQNFNNPQCWDAAMLERARSEMIIEYSPQRRIREYMSVIESNL